MGQGGLRAAMFKDRYGRRVGYLRLSLTKACAMRCLYCRPAWLGHPRGEAMLTPTEIEALVRHLAEHRGLTKVRLTGGDPSSRADLLEIIERVAAVPGVAEVAMTTHGLALAARAREYAAAGLKRVNVSLDTLDGQRFARMTGVDGLDRVISGIDAAAAAGLGPMKINTVVVRGENEEDLVDLLRFSAERRLEQRFIELMPMGPLADAWSERYVPENQMRGRLDSAVRSWTALDQGHDAARRYRVVMDDGMQATVGFITPMSCNFCAACNRIRVAADGGFYPCLMDEPAGTLLPALRPTFDAVELDRLIAAGLSGKAAEHPHRGFVTMTHIGG